MIRDYPYEKERRDYKKLIKWDHQLEIILDSVQRIRTVKIREIEQKLKIKFDQSLDSLDLNTLNILLIFRVKNNHLY